VVLGIVSAMTDPGGWLGGAATIAAVAEAFRYATS